MKILHSNQGLFGGYHFRAIQDRGVIKIQEIDEATQRRYTTIAQIPAESWDRCVEYKDLSNPATLYKLAKWWNQ